MKKENVIMIIRIIISLILGICAFIAKNETVKMILFLISYFNIGYDILIKSVKNIFKGNFLDENFLMSIATIGAIAIKELPEAVAVMVFYQIGELFQDMAVDKSRKSIADLMAIRPDFANLQVGDETKQVSPEEVKVDDIIIVKPGEKIPLDGIVIEGMSMLDTKAITGEPVPRTVNVDDEVISGCINLNSMIKVRVIREFSNSTVNKILELVENASSKKSKSEKFITKFARIYTPIVVLSATIIAIVPTFIFGLDTFSKWLSRALVFLVVSCPCALVISVPLGFFAGIGSASKKGILVKGSSYLENFSKVKTIVFDKTGTLTEGIFEVQEIVPENIKAYDLIKYAAYAENYSIHPIATSIKKAYGEEIDEGKISSLDEISGKGINANIFGKDILVGNSKLLEDRNIEFKKVNDIGSVVYVAINKKYAGYILISDRIKENTKESITTLNKKHKINPVILTGDSKRAAKKVAKELEIEEFYSELLPTDKVEIIEKILEKKEKDSKVAFVGDGINDSPVLARADIGIAMGDIGSDSAIEAADIVIMNGDLNNLIEAINVSRNTVRIVKQNIVFAISVKILILILSAFGFANLWLAVFADVGVSIICILNSMRNLRK